MRCLLYIDLNMVRAGVVKHLSEWLMCGYNEIQNPPERYRLLDQKGLMEFCGINNMEQLKEEYRQWVDEALKEEDSRREATGSESIAVGNRAFIEATQTQLELIAAKGRVEENNGQYILREEPNPYSAHFDPEKGPLSPKNSYFWNDNAY